MSEEFSALLKSAKSDRNILLAFEEKEQVFCQTRTGPRRLIKLPLILTPDLSYFVGVMLGDGYIINERYKFGIDKGNKIYLETVILPLILDLFNLRLNVIETKTSWRVSARSKVVWLLLTRVFELPIGKRNSITIPKLILTSSDKIKLNFIAGVLDTDGGKRGGGFGFTTAHQEFNEQIIKILEEQGFSVSRDSWLNKKYYKIYYGWRIKSKSVLRRFNETIPLRNPKRLEFLRTIMQGYRSG